MIMTSARRALLIGLALLFSGCPSSPSDRTLARQFNAATADGPTIDHEVWQQTLDRYLIEAEDMNRVDYAQLASEGKAPLTRYLDAMAAVDPTAHPRDEQMAYWINVYNALTVKLIADQWPVTRILDLGSGLPGRGPWRDPMFEVQGVMLSLDDIEHRILRQFWREPRIHFAVNCASVGCPDLRARAFTGATLEDALDDATRSYLASTRGVTVGPGQRTLTLSSLFDWYAADFGADEAAVRRWLAARAPDDTRAELLDDNRVVTYHYDWSLNGTE